MKFKDVIDALENGKMVRRESWEESIFICLGSDSLTIEDILQNDWEIVTESGKTFHDVLECFLRGGKVKRKSWKYSPGIWIKDDDLKATDWIEEIK